MVKVLVTGGTGSLGTMIVEKMASSWDITVLSRDEYKQNQMRRKYGIDTIICDIRDYIGCLEHINDYDLVIHAAALKRIEVGEEQPEEIVKTNILGTINVVKACKHNGIQRVLLVSTDKACLPLNTYGVSKAMAEKIFVSNNYNCVRYGNVVNSRGSVIPLFDSQRRAGIPLTITNPMMTRFIIELDKAVELIKEAILSPMNGSIYVPKLKAARITDLANLISDNQEVIGSKVGEKTHEMLIGEEECDRTIAVRDFFVIQKEKTPINSGEQMSSDKAIIMTEDEIRSLYDKLGITHL